MPLGGLAGGLLVSGYGLTAAMLAIGAAYFLVTMLPAVDRRWRDMDRRPVTADEGRVPENADTASSGHDPRHGVIPDRIARIAACTRSRLPVLASTFVTWVFTVLIERWRRSEISVLFSPAPTSARTSCSRPVSR